MRKLIAPIEDFDSARINNTLHGRSVYKSADDQGHNVFKGWSTWQDNGRKGVGAGLDVGGKGWKTPIMAICDGMITRWVNDMKKLEVIYFEAPGVVAVYAHVNYTPELPVGTYVKQGQPLGVVRGDLNWPHLHFELWLNRRAVAAPSPIQLRALMLTKFAAEHGVPSVWAKDAWEWAVENDLTNDGPTEPVTKQQVMTYLHRYHLMLGG